MARFAWTTAKQIAASRAGPVNRAKLDATTKADIRRYMIEDGEDPDMAPRLARPVTPQAVRGKLGMTQVAFASLPGIPAATLRNWEQNRFTIEPAARTLLGLIDREPDAVLRVLRSPDRVA